MNNNGFNLNTIYSTYKFKNMKNWESYLNEVVEEIAERENIDTANAKLVAGFHAPTVRGCYEREMEPEEAVNLIYGH